MALRGFKCHTSYAFKGHVRGSVMQPSRGGQVIFCTYIRAKHAITDTCGHISLSYLLMFELSEEMVTDENKNEVNRLASTGSLS